MKRNREIILAVSIAIGVAWTGIVPAHASQREDSFKLVVSATGQHPSGGSFDGFRVFLLPIETTTVNEPDIVVRIVGLDGARWLGNSEGSSPCPDSIKCEFLVDTVNVEEPFAILVLDSDPWLTDVFAAIDSSGQYAGKTLSIAGELADKVEIPEAIETQWKSFLASMPSKDVVAEKVNELASRVPVGKQTLQSFVDYMSAGGRLQALKKRFVPGTHDLIDAVIFVPDSGSSRDEISKLAELVREDVDQIAGTLLENAERRVSGQLRKEYFSDCSIIACDFSYSSVHFMENYHD